MLLSNLFDIVVTFFKKYRKRYPDSNYIDAWGAIVCALGSNANIEFNNWCKEILPGGMVHATFTEKVLDLPEKTVNGRGEEKLAEQNHFMIQIFRIPLHMTPTLGHLMLIACYIGLVQSKLRAKDFPTARMSLNKTIGLKQLLTSLGTSKIFEAQKLSLLIWDKLTQNPKQKSYVPCTTLGRFSKFSLL